MNERDDVNPMVLDLDQIREAADIVEVISEVVPLRDRGKAYDGLCPFHREKTPSFNVDRDRGFFHCFGCGRGGDVFSFVSLTKNVAYFEAVGIVASRFGVTLPRNWEGLDPARRAESA